MSKSLFSTPGWVTAWAGLCCPCGRYRLSVVVKDTATDRGSNHLLGDTFTILLLCNNPVLNLWSILSIINYVFNMSHSFYSKRKMLILLHVYRCAVMCSPCRFGILYYFLFHCHCRILSLSLSLVLCPHLKCVRLALSLLPFLVTKISFPF